MHRLLLILAVLLGSVRVASADDDPRPDAGVADAAPAPAPPPAPADPVPHHRVSARFVCTDCHIRGKWVPSTITPVLHADFGYPLLGAHVATPCIACHPDGAYAGTPSACSACHKDTRHGGRVSDQCEGCHTEDAWKQVPPFDHGKTEFPLELRHSALPCLACHDARKRPVVNANCRTCHGDPHRGGTQVDCNDCHRPDRWRVIRFDHDVTGYALTGYHRITRCTDCHRNNQFTGVRTECFTCHALDRPRTQDHLAKLACDDCHITTSWRAVRH